jgi:large subunit ribosomal protein L15
MRLSDLKDNPGATQAGKRVGRGIGSGKGKTAGRGHKGQKSRSGVAIKGFEGGQMPIHRRLPKRGFNNLFAKDFNEINVGRLQAAVDKKTLDPKKTVTVEALAAAGLIGRVRDGVRLLGQGELKTRLAIEVTGASAGAVKAVEKAGGSVTIVEMPKRAPKLKEKKPKSASAEGETPPAGEGKSAARAKPAPKAKAGDAKPAAKKPAKPSPKKSEKDS